VAAPDPYHAWAAGDYGTILAYTAPNIPEMKNIYLPIAIK
jgi:hypothetical protein